MYGSPITCKTPTAFVVLLDQSGSMNERIVFGGHEMAKSKAVSLVASSFLDELVHRARRENGVRDYYEMAVLGYGGAGVRSLISPPGGFTTPSKLIAGPVERVRTSRERLLPTGRSAIAVTEQNLWVAERAEGATLMCAAMEEALKLVSDWCRRPKNANSYPPTIINITDGDASDGSADEIRDLAGRIRATGTADGPTLFINVHLVPTETGAVRRGGATGSSGGAGQSASPMGVAGDEYGKFAPVLFPASPEELPDHRYAQLLWEISSDLPDGYGFPGARGVAFNAGIAELAAAMNIGSVNLVTL